MNNWSQNDIFSNNEIEKENTPEKNINDLVFNDIDFDDSKAFDMFKSDFNVECLSKINKVLSKSLNYPHGYPLVSLFVNEKDSIIEFYVNYVANTAVRILEEDIIGDKPTKEDIANSAFPDIMAAGDHEYINDLMYTLDPSKVLGASTQLRVGITVSEDGIPFLTVVDDKGGVIGNDKYENLVEKITSFVSGLKFPVSSNESLNNILMDSISDNLEKTIVGYKSTKPKISLDGPSSFGKYGE